MLSDIFYWVLNMSLLGSVCGLLILMLRQIKPIPRFAVYLLWVIPFIRLWVPFGLASRYSLLGILADFTTKTVPIRNHLPELTMANTIMGAESYFPITYKTQQLEKVFGIASILWLVGVVLCVAAALTLYFYFKAQLRGAEHVKDNIYRLSSVDSPAVYGIVRPKIILPSHLPKEAYQWVLLHERVHIRRRDNLWRMAAVITACLHWFNPLVWLFVKAFLTDMEFACDSKVLKQTPRPSQYALALLNTAASHSLFYPSFGGAKTKQRIRAIVSYKRLSLIATLCTAVLLLAIAFVLLTNAPSGGIG